MSEITITSFVDYKDKEGNLELIPRGTDARNLNHWDVKRWWYEGRTIYEACARVNNTDNGDVLYIAASTNNPYLKIEYYGGEYIFDGDYKRKYIDRILIETSGGNKDIEIPLRGPIGEVAPPVAPPSPLEIGLNQGANWVGSNVYEVGQVVIAKTAEYTGGVDPVTYRWRIQTRATSGDAWVLGSWTNTINEKIDVPITLASTGQIKFQSQAKDVNGSVNSITSTKTVEPEPTPEPPPEPTLPWEENDGGVFHIKDVTGSSLNLYGGPYTAWDIDGTNEREIYSVAVGEEVVFATAPNSRELFTYNSSQTWEFGELTNTSKVTAMDFMFYQTSAFNGDISGWDTSNVTDMTYMFYEADAFNQDIGGWDTSNVTGMTGMFYHSGSFNQDLSGWCVSEISSKPSSFDTRADSWADQLNTRPKWGTCPRGEDQA